MKAQSGWISKERTEMTTNVKYTLAFGAGTIGITISEEQYNEIIEEAKEVNADIKTKDDGIAHWTHIRKNGRLIATLAHWKDSYEEEQ